ncbi:MAG TPA: nitroreductase/quinone reductase family protein [Acidimicrobiales bacterium]
MASNDEGTGPEGAPGTATLGGRVSFSAHGRPWMIVMKPTRRGKAIDRALVRWTGFSLVSFEFAQAAGRPYHRDHLLLTSIGWRSGDLRTSCLPFYRHGQDLVVCGTKGGGPTDPFWVKNLEAEPRCWIRVNRIQTPATARVSAGSERAEVFESVAEQHPDLRRYQDQTALLGRDVPLVLLTPSRA